MSVPKKLLVMTSSTGAGHDTHARATRDWCEIAFGNKVEVTIDQTLENSHFIYRGAVDLYNFIQRTGPGIHHFYYNFVEFLEVLNNGMGIGFGKDYFVQLLERVRPDAILSMHDCLNLGYFEVAKEILGPIPCGTYCPEFAGGYGFSRNWINVRADAFLGRTEETCNAALRRKMAPNRVHVAGQWAPPAFYRPAMASEAKSVVLRNLGLAPRRFTLLLATGGSGAQNHLRFLEAIRPLGDSVQVIVLCGHNLKARERVDKWAERTNCFPVRALPFTSEMPDLLESVSAVVARAGATTAGEALLTGCPILFNALGGIMPQEIPTWRYFKARNLGALLHKPSDLASCLRKWLENIDDYEEIRSKLLKYRNEDPTPVPALRDLLGL